MLQKRIVQEFAPYIEDDDELFFTLKLSLSTKIGHFFGLDISKISVCSVKMVTERHRINCGVFQLMKQGGFWVCTITAQQLLFTAVLLATRAGVMVVRWTLDKRSLFPLYL